PGDLVVATAVRDETGDELVAPRSVRQQALRALHGLRCFEGDLLCTTSVAATEAEKLALARPGTLAVDMESHPAARAAAEAGVPWLALRAIVDPLRSSLPSFAREPQGSYLGPALKYALSGPRAAGDLLQLARRARIAAPALEVALRRLGPLLAAAEAHRWGRSPPVPAGGARLVYTSSIATVGAMHNGVLPDERSMPDGPAPGPYKESKREAEALVREEAQRGLDAVIVNPTFPVGVGDVKPTPTGAVICYLLDGRLM